MTNKGATGRLLKNIQNAQLTQTQDQGCHSTFCYRDRIPTNWENYWHFLSNSKIRILNILSKGLESVDIYISEHNVLSISKYWSLTAQILLEHNFLYTQCKICDVGNL